MSTKRKIRNGLYGALLLVVMGGLIYLLHPRNWQYYTDGISIHQSAREADVRLVLWEDPERLAYDFNAVTNNIEPVISRDGRMMVFARGRAKENAELFSATWDGERWSEARPLTHVNTEADELGPEFSSDNLLLYFYSDREDGLGGYDLWVSPWNGTYWDTPANLGPWVNSPYNEYDPAVAPGDDRVFFSSNRPAPEDLPQSDTAWKGTLRELASTKDYDIFQCVASVVVDTNVPPAAASNELAGLELPEGIVPSFTNTVRIAALNTPYDEGQVDFTRRGDFVYFSSNREGGVGGFDLYRSRVFNGAFLDIESLGRPVNSLADDMDPALWMEGHSLVFSSNRSEQDRHEFTLYHSTTREVMTRLENARLALMWEWLKSNWWLLLLLLLGLLALWWLIRLLMSERFRRDLSLLTQCIIASVMLHLLLAFLLSLWYVTSIIVESTKGPMQVAISESALARERLNLELREEVSDLPQNRSNLPTDRRIEPVELPDFSPPEALMHVPKPTTVNQDFKIDFQQPDDAEVPLEQEPVDPRPRVGLPEFELSMTPEPLEYVEPRKVDAREVEPRREQPELQPLPREVEEFASRDPQEQHLVEPELPAFTPAPGAAPEIAPVSQPAHTPLPELPEFAVESELPIVEFDAAETPLEMRELAPVNEPVRESPREMREQNLVEKNPGQPEFPERADKEFAAEPAPTLNAITNEVSELVNELSPVDPSPEIPTDRSNPHAPPPADLETLELPVEFTMETSEPAPHTPPNGEEIRREMPGDLAQKTDQDIPESAPRLTHPDALDVPAPERPEIITAVDFPLNEEAPAALVEQGGLPEIAMDLPEMELGLEAPLESKPISEITYSLRDPAVRDRLIEELGGSDETEEAINRALQFLARTQEQEGHWSMPRHGGEAGHDAAATGLAALCFMGHGATHQNDHLYREQVRRAIDWLREHVNDDGRFAAKDMYDQGIATIALAEAYALTKDPDLKAPLERAVGYIVRAQHAQTGGWRYQPGESGDTSVVGWQVMALRSAKLGGIEVPEAAMKLSGAWLDKVAGGRQGGHYGYQGRSPNRSMVAEGMFCQQLLGHQPGAARMKESARYINANLPNARQKDFYYWYYGCLAMYQHKGPAWDEWNPRMKSILLKSQERNGNRAGSWSPQGDHYGNRMGRVVSTALATLSLEVYYRYLPMYGEGYAEGKRRAL